MFKIYLKTAIRNLTRNKAFTAINITGLALGLAAFWAIVLYVATQLSFDKYHTNANRIYRVAQHATWDGGQLNLACTPALLGPALQSEYPEIEKICRFDIEGGGTIFYNNQQIAADDILLADSTTFSQFSFAALHGNTTTALYNPNSIVLTQTLAEKIFGDAASAINKIVELGKGNPLTVTAVIEDVPANSQFKFSALRSINGHLDDNWNSSYLYTYIMLKPSADVQQLQSKLPAFFTKYIKPSMGDVQYRMELQPLASIHLHSNLDYEMSANGNMSYIYIFSLVAVLILVIASINYMNLSTARSSARLKEIGVRKVNGSSKAQLIGMFLSESIVLTFLASIIAIVILQLALPWFQQFTQQPLDIWHFGMVQTILLVIAFCLIAGCMSGIYPAIFLSSFKLIPALKGKGGNQNNSIIFRKSLVVFQFVITIVMNTGSCIIYQQLQYVNKKDLGFNKDQLISFHLNDNLRDKIPALRQSLLQNPLIESVAAAGNPLGTNFIGKRDFKIIEEGRNETQDRLTMQLTIDEEFLPTLQTKLLQGRNFSETMGTDKINSVIVNETLIKLAGWTNAVGKQLQFGRDTAGNPLTVKIIGVVKDFNVYSLQHKIEPLILQLPRYNGEKDNLYVRLSKKDIAAALAFTQKIYHQFDTESSFDYHFLDQNFARQYETEQRQGGLLLIFTILAISLACLGLFGLIMFSAEQRKKEIGVRKVLGSSVQGIVLLLSKDLIQLILLAILIATPLAWLAMDKWLQSFAYRIHISWWIFGVSGIIALLIAFATISVQAVKAALANPVKSIRTE